MASPNVDFKGNFRIKSKPKLNSLNEKIFCFKIRK